jgi:hypothetical protein
MMPPGVRKTPERTDRTDDDSPSNKDRTQVNPVPHKNAKANLYLFILSNAPGSLSGVVAYCLFPQGTVMDHP